MDERMESIKKKIPELFDEVYVYAYNGGYKKGCDDAWEAAKKIQLPLNEGGIPSSDIHEIFNVRFCADVLSTFSASVVVEKIRAYEEKKQEENKFRVGDEIKDKLSNKGVIVEISDDYITILWNHVSLNTYNKLCYHFTKTGRHFPEIVEVFKKMKEEE